MTQQIFNVVRHFLVIMHNTVEYANLHFRLAMSKIVEFSGCSFGANVKETKNEHSIAVRFSGCCLQAI